MIDDVLGMVDYYVWTNPGSLDDLFTSEPSLQQGRGAREDLRRSRRGTDACKPPVIRGRPTAGHAHPRAVSRLGLGQHRPIMKGVFIRAADAVRRHSASSAGRQRRTARAAPGHDHAPSRAGAHREAGNGVCRLPQDDDQSARLRHRGFRRAWAASRPSSACSMRHGEKVGTSRSTRRRCRRSARATTRRPPARPTRCTIVRAAKPRRAWRATTSASPTRAGRTSTSTGAPSRRCARRFARGQADLSDQVALTPRFRRAPASSDQEREKTDGKTGNRYHRRQVSVARRLHARACLSSRRSPRGQRRDARPSREAAAVLVRHRSRRRLRSQHVPRRGDGAPTASICSRSQGRVRARSRRRLPADIGGFADLERAEHGADRQARRQDERAAAGSTCRSTSRTTPGCTSATTRATTATAATSAECRSLRDPPSIRSWRCRVVLPRRQQHQAARDGHRRPASTCRGTSRTRLQQDGHHPEHPRHRQLARHVQRHLRSARHDHARAPAHRRPRARELQALARRERGVSRPATSSASSDHIGSQSPSSSAS